MKNKQRLMDNVFVLYIIVVSFFFVGLGYLWFLNEKSYDAYEQCYNKAYWHDVAPGCFQKRVGGNFQTSGVFLYSYISNSSTSSMMPLINTGSNISIYNVTGAQDLSVCDIIKFRHPYKDDTFILHRIISIDIIDGETVYQTAGDNNKFEDNFTITLKDVVGEVGKVVTT